MKELFAKPCWVHFDLSGLLNDNLQETIHQTSILYTFREVYNVTSLVTGGAIESLGEIYKVWFFKDKLIKTTDYYTESILYKNNIELEQLTPQNLIQPIPIAPSFLDVIEKTIKNNNLKIKLPQASIINATYVEDYAGYVDYTYRLIMCSDDYTINNHTLNATEIHILRLDNNFNTMDTYTTTSIPTNKITI